MTTLTQITTRFAEQAGKPGARLLRGLSRSIFVNPHDDRTLCSWGTHFPLAQIMPGPSGDRSWWLLNGDTYSVSTSNHQRIVRDACHSTGLPVLIVPFSCLAAARIDRESITPVDIQPETFEEITHHAPAEHQIPPPHRHNARQLPDGRWEWTIWRHRLGASVFRATYTSQPAAKAGPDVPQVRCTACFLSAFDEQERRPLYFLCQLPAEAAPPSVAEALQALKPAEVIAAQEAGLPVTRQGDVFAIPLRLPTRKIPGKTEHGGRLLNLSHTATQVRVADDGTTYARGILRHSPLPSWRTPEHQHRPMGDRKTWHLIVKNTVPLDAHGNSRAWSRSGNVD
jgi:hypothetical protein